MTRSLIGPSDPAAVQRVNPGGRSAVLLIGDHAGDAVPAALDLGVSPVDMARHIAVDIGVRALGTALADRMDAAFIHQSYSRLVVDCNRDPAAADAMPSVSDGTVVPANVALTPDDRAARVAAIHAPYQQAIGDALSARVARGEASVLVSLHSFTPVMGGVRRPWHVGILHDGHEDRVARAMLAALGARGDLVVGDNKPYCMDRIDYTVPRHAFAAGLAYVEIEVRQDLIAAPEGVERWCAILAETLALATFDRQAG